MKTSIEGVEDMQTGIEEAEDMQTGIETKKAAEDIEDGPRLVTLTKPIKFEGVTYRKIDLSAMDNITAEDMIEINRRLSRSGNVDFVQELSLEYALNLVQVATGIPLEFFLKLPPYESMQLKNRVAGFLYRRD